MSVAIENFIPHRPPMRWIDALTSCTETTASATVCFSADHFAVADTSVLETALVECVAQTIAAAIGRRTQEQGQADGHSVHGMLVAVSSFRIQSRPQVGQSLCIEVRELKRFGPMLLVSGVVSCEGQVIASGELTLHA